MRDLLLHERRFVRNILRLEGIEETQEPLKVTEEFYAPPRQLSSKRFNNDFFLRFAESAPATKRKSYCSAIHPNTLGVEVFLTLDAISNTPIHTELLGGEGLPKKLFKDQLEIIEQEFATLQIPIHFSRMAYSRIFIIDNDICFLGFPRSLVPNFEGSWHCLSQDSRSSVACSMKGNELVFIDGWIQTHVVETARKLSVIPSS